MTAMKCDRCKAYCDINSKRSEVVILCDKRIELDLCPDCTAQLLRWIKNEAEFFEREKTDWAIQNSVRREANENT